MKRGIGTLGMMVLLALASCESRDTKDSENRVTEDPPQPSRLGKNLTVGPDLLVEQVKSKFRKGSKGCQEGFGICEVIALETDSIPNDTARESYHAKFILSKGDSEMLIEFTEHIPHFSNEFVVDLMTGVPDLFGYEYVRLVPGIYQTDGGIGDYGGVVVKIEKGRRLDEIEAKVF